MTDLVRIDFACNDPDNGNAIGHAPMISLPGGALELAARRWNILNPATAPRFREIEHGFTRQSFVLAGKAWPYVKSKDWYGNWCWCAYWVPKDIGGAFLTWLHRRNLYLCEGGDARLADAWQNDEPFKIDAAELFGLLAGYH